MNAEPLADQSALLQMEKDWNQALKNKDVAWMERTFADDMTDISSADGKLHTKTEDIAAMKADKTIYESLELSNLKARVDGNTGIVTGINEIKGRDDTGQPFAVSLAFTDTYIRRAGRWMVWASQHTRVKP